MATPQPPSEASSGTKKLAKRIKPKVNIGRAASTREVTKEKEPEKLDTGQNATAIEEKIDSKINEAKDEKSKIMVNTQSVTKGEPADHSIEIKNEDKESVSEKTETAAKADPPKRLSKRLKVGPKLSSTRPNTGSSNEKAKQLETIVDSKADQKRPDVENVKTSDVSKVEKASNENPETVTKTIEESVESEDTKSSPSTIATNPTVEKDITSSASPKAVDSPKAVTSINQSSKLQKRKKVMPNLKMPKPKLKISEETDNDKVNTESNAEFSTKEDLTSQTQIDDTPSQKIKRVHFETTNTVETSEENSNKLENTEKSTIGTELLEKQLDKEPVKPSPSILKKDQYDYSSQSEGETSHSTSLGKGKKTFKPNLGVKRRKRLSSFSAYSSCDDEEDEAKAKKKVKVSIYFSRQSTNH